VAELRQQRLAAARLLVALRIPDAEEGSGAGNQGGRRTQRRGTRGVYQFPGA
jgi:hypothetical protein